jgi:hypothetical protein
VCQGVSTGFYAIERGQVAVFDRVYLFQAFEVGIDRAPVPTKNLGLGTGGWILLPASDPTPAGWPNGGTLLFAGGPCVRPSVKLRTGPASWYALLRPYISIKPGRGVTGFGSFCRNKSGSPTVPKPGNIEHHVE